MSGPGEEKHLEPGELETWASIATVLEWLPAALDAQLEADAQLTHFEYGMLFALADAPDRTLRLSMLADYANSTLSRLSRAVTRLQSRGWVVRSTDPSDGRFTLARLTESGLRTLEQARPGHTELVRRLVFDNLTPAQARQLGDATRNIAAAVRSDGGWRPDGSAP